MVTFVVNQDRREVYDCTERSYFNIKTQYYHGIEIGHSLYIDRHYLGTFETMAQLYNELRHIHNSSEEIYGIRGYSDESFTIKEMFG